MKNWLSGRKRPASPEHVKRTAVGLAHELGLFSDDELATRNDAGLLALVSDRVGQARRFIVFATALVLLINGGSRPLARAMPKNVAVAIGAIYKWADIDRAPRAISESNAFLNRLAIFARAELQKRRVRIAAERGAAGDRRIIFAYLLGISGQEVSDIPPECIIGFPGNVVDWFAQQVQPIQMAMRRTAAGESQSFADM